MTPIDKNLLEQWNPKHPESVPLRTVLELEIMKMDWRKETLMETERPADEDEWFTSIHRDADPSDSIIKETYLCQWNMAVHKKDDPYIGKCPNCPVAWNEYGQKRNCRGWSSPMHLYQSLLHDHKLNENAFGGKRKATKWMREKMLDALDRSKELLVLALIYAGYQEQEIRPSKKEIENAISPLYEDLCRRDVNQSATLKSVSVMWRWIAAETLEKRILTPKKEWFDYINRAFPEITENRRINAGCYCCERSNAMGLPCKKSCPIDWTPNRTDHQQEKDNPEEERCMRDDSPYYTWWTIMRFVTEPTFGTKEQIKTTIRCALAIAAMADRALETLENEKGG